MHGFLLNRMPCRSDRHTLEGFRWRVARCCFRFSMRVRPSTAGRPAAHAPPSPYHKRPFPLSRRVPASWAARVCAAASGASRSIARIAPDRCARAGLSVSVIVKPTGTHLMWPLLQNVQTLTATFFRVTVLSRPKCRRARSCLRAAGRSRRTANPTRSSCRASSERGP